MLRFILSVLVSCCSLSAQYKLDQASPPPSEVVPAIAQKLNPAGIKIVGDNGSTWMELWLVASTPSGPASTEQSVTLTTVPIGSLLGILRFPGKGSDRRGQDFKPGVYTLRYGNYPINGDHQGVAPQRDFFVLAPASADTNPATVPTFDTLMDLSRKASGTRHPAVLSVWKADPDDKTGLAKQGDTDWVLTTNLGSTKISIIVAGAAGS